MPMPDLPTSLMASFTTRNQTELRKLLELVYDAAAAGAATFKYIEEQGEAADSGTLLSTSEIVATVAAKDSDIVGSSDSVLVGGFENGILNSTGSVVAGGTVNACDGAVSSGIFGGSANNVEGYFSTVIGGTGNEISSAVSALIGGSEDCSVTVGENVAVIASEDSTITAGMRSAIIAGQNCTASAQLSLTTGDGANGHRQWAISVGGGSTVTTSLGQAVILAGTTETPSDEPSAIYTGNTGAILMLPNSVIGIQALVTATRISDLETYYRTLTGVVKRVGTADPVIAAQDATGNGGDAALATTDAVLAIPPTPASGPMIEVTGLEDTPIRWSVVVIITEQQFPS